MTCPEPPSISVIEAPAPDFQSCPCRLRPTALPPRSSLRVRESRSLQGGTAPAIQTVLQWSMWGGELPGYLPGAPHMPGHPLCSLGPLPQPVSASSSNSRPLVQPCWLKSLPDDSASVPIGQSWLYWEGSGTWHLSPSL